MARWCAPPSHWCQLLSTRRPPCPCWRRGGIADGRRRCGGTRTWRGESLDRDRLLSHKGGAPSSRRERSMSRSVYKWLEEREKTDAFTLQAVANGNGLSSGDVMRSLLEKYACEQVTGESRIESLARAAGVSAQKLKEFLCERAMRNRSARGMKQSGTGGNSRNRHRSFAGRTGRLGWRVSARFFAAPPIALCTFARPNRS
jgi:hypothetical protein